MIDKRPLGATGIEVSVVGLGAWQLGRSAEWPTGPDPDDARRIVRAALDAGVTFIDTAPGYAGGQSELNVGAALAGVPRDRYVLCTKFGHRPDGGTDWSASAIEPSIRGSAERMGVEHIDVVLLHNPPPEVIGSDEHYSALEEVAQKGLIRAYGASVDTSRELDALPPTVSVTEVRLSALHQEPLPAIRPGTIVKVPLESGWLSGRYDAESTFTDVRARWSPADVALRAALVEEFHGLLPEGMSTVEGALRFLLSYPEVSTVIPGTRSLDHLAVSIAAVAEGALPRDTVDAVQSWYAERIGDRALSW